MKGEKEGMGQWIRLVAFFLIPAALVAVFNQILIPPHEGVYYAFYELSQRDDVEIAIVGSSVVQTDFNPNLISDRLDMEVYSVAAGHMALQGATAATKVMYKTNRPRYICLVIEPDTFAEQGENRQTQQMLLPHTMDPVIGIPYYLDLCSQDGKYFERLFVFRSFMAKSLEDVGRAIKMRMNPEKYYAESEFGRSGYYKGRGYGTKGTEGNGDAMLRFMSLRPVGDYAISDKISTYAKKKLLEYKALCERHGSQMIVVMPPNMIAHALAKDGFAQKHVELANFCKAQDIPYFNFYFAKESFLPRLDQYYADVLHMDYRAADIFSEKFADVMRRYMEGEETEQLFYHTTEEFINSIHCITNVWMDKAVEYDQEVYTADCLRGASVIPEYSFYAVDQNGAMEQLQPYSQKNTYTCPARAYADRRIRVYARPKGSEEMSTIFYDIICSDESRRRE